MCCICIYMYDIGTINEHKNVQLTKLTLFKGHGFN